MVAARRTGFPGPAQGATDHAGPPQHWAGYSARTSPTDKAAEVDPLRPTGPRLRSTSADPVHRPLPVVVETFRSRPRSNAIGGPLGPIAGCGAL